MSRSVKQFPGGWWHNPGIAKIIKRRWSRRARKYNDIGNRGFFRKLSGLSVYDVKIFYPYDFSINMGDEYKRK